MLPQCFLGRAVLCLLLASVLVGCGGAPGQYFYNSLADADKAGEITRGWIPDDIIPSNSRDIHLAEELSPSHEWCAFEFVPTDAQNLRKNLKSVDGLPRAVTRVPNPGAPWWPKMLQGRINAAAVHHAGFDLYVVQRPANGVEMGIYLFAVNWPEGHGFFYWTYDPYTPYQANSWLVGKPSIWSGRKANGGYAVCQGFAFRKRTVRECRREIPHRLGWFLVTCATEPRDVRHGATACACPI
jgi:hypothetical protein